MKPKILLTNIINNKGACYLSESYCDKCCLKRKRCVNYELSQADSHKFSYKNAVEMYLKKYREKSFIKEFGKGYLEEIFKDFI